jgi:hypothetical protein
MAFKIPTLKLGGGGSQEQQHQATTKDTNNDNNNSMNEEDEDENEQDNNMTSTTNKTTVPALKLNFSLSQNSPISPSATSRSGLSTPISSQRSLSSLGSPQHHQKQHETSTSSTGIKMPTLNLVKGSALMDKLNLAAQSTAFVSHQKSPSADAKASSSPSVQVDLIVPRFCKLSIDSDTTSETINNKISEQISKKWFASDSKDTNFELYKLQSVNHKESDVHYACRLSHSGMFCCMCHTDTNHLFYSIKCTYFE